MTTVTPSAVVAAVVVTVPLEAAEPVRSVDPAIRVVTVDSVDLASLLGGRVDASGRCLRVGVKPWSTSSWAGSRTLINGCVFRRLNVPGCSPIPAA